MAGGMRIVIVGAGPAGVRAAETVTRFGVRDGTTTGDFRLVLSRASY